jgi:arylsulfatase A-like enzyme
VAASAAGGGGCTERLMIVLDDTGFGQLGCYGSPIATPNFDALAAGGLLYTNMHTTALCSPSRSCIITGRNHHANATAAINEMATGYPGYNGTMPFEDGYFEMIGNRAIDHDGWRAVCPWPGPSFAEAEKAFSSSITAADLADLDAHRWELYRVAEDPAENHNLADTHRDKLIEMIALWYVGPGNTTCCRSTAP